MVFIHSGCEWVCFFHIMIWGFYSEFDNLPWKGNEHTQISKPYFFFKGNSAVRKKKFKTYDFFFQCLRIHTIYWMKISSDLFSFLMISLKANETIFSKVALLRPVKDSVCFAQNFRKKVCFKFKLRFCFLLKLNILIKVLQTFYFLFLILFQLMLPPIGHSAIYKKKMMTKLKFYIKKRNIIFLTNFM